MLYFGFDPSLTCTGMCLVEDDGKYIKSSRISTTNNRWLPNRIYYIFNEMEKTISELKSNYPDIKVSLELPIKKLYNDDLLIMVKTCLWLNLVKYRIPFVCFSPTHIQNYMKESGPQFNYSSKSTGTCKLSKLFLEREGVSNLYTGIKKVKKLQKDESDAFMVARLGVRFWKFHDMWHSGSPDTATSFTEKELEMFGSKTVKKSNKKVRVLRGIIHNKGLEYFTFDD